MVYYKFQTTNIKNERQKREDHKMIGWEEVYKVLVATVPLYVALAFGYTSIRWMHMFRPDQCDAINRFNCYFIMPFFTFQFTASVDPYHMNYRFLAGDVVAKAIVGSTLALWANLWPTGDLAWTITSFSLSSMNNTLVVGVPLLKAMYGALGEDLVVQSSVIQSLLWFPILLFLLEFKRTCKGDAVGASDTNVESDVESSKVTTRDSDFATVDINEDGVGTERRKVSGFMMIKKVLVKLGNNPNSYACAIGLIWSLLAKRWHFEMLSIMEESIQIMAKGGSGIAMFTMGLFMALQDKVISCGVRLTLYAMLLRFVGGPLTTIVGSLVFGLRSTVLRIAIVQAALPQSIASFVYAHEYGLHANILSTAVVFGTIVSLPLLIGYFFVLDVLH